MKQTSTIFLAITIILGVGCTASKKLASIYFADFPAGTSPQEIGKRIALRYVEVPYQNFNQLPF